MAPLLPCRGKLARLQLLRVAFFLLAMSMGSRADIYKDIELIWGASRTYFFMDGESEALALSLDQSMGSAFKSRDMYLYGRFDIDIKLIDGDSAGTVCTVYLISEGPWGQHDEIDLEFLGNATGEAVTLHTNVFANGVGGREQQFRLWFNPSADYHTYSIVWNPQHITILVDGMAIRDFKNNDASGLPFPAWQQMRVYGSLWSAEDWATQGGRVKTDWSRSPFVSYYRNYNVTPCRPSSPAFGWCGGEPAGSSHFDLDQKALSDISSARQKYMIYDYCGDRARFNGAAMPAECTL